MTTVTRRQVLKSGAAVVGGMAGILATGRAPAFAQGTTCLLYTSPSPRD